MPELLRYELPRAIDVGSETEIDKNDGDSRRRIRPHAENTGRPVHGGFNQEGDERFDFFRSHPVGFRENRHRRRRQIGKHIHRRAQRDDAAIDQ